MARRIVIGMEDCMTGTGNGGGPVSARIDAYLDGELPREALTREECAAADAIRQAATSLRAELPAAPAHMEATVLRRIRDLGLSPAAAGESAAQRADGPAALPAPAAAGVRSAPARTWSSARALVEGLWRPRQVSFGLRPAYAVAVAMVAVLIIAVPRGSGPGYAGAGLDAAAPPVFVQFRLDAEGATNVMLAGSFTEWQPEYELVETQPGVWTVLVALQPGVHDYAFVVDGETWVADPAAPAVDDGFGGSNSRLALLPAS
jgi:hypothetical protein